MHPGQRCENIAGVFESVEEELGMRFDHGLAIRLILEVRKETKGGAGISVPCAVINVLYQYSGERKDMRPYGEVLKRYFVAPYLRSLLPLKSN